MITTAGKAAARRYLANQIPSWAQAIAVGVMNTAATAGDSTLGFEVARVEIESASIDATTNEIIFKATLPTDLEGKLYEAGLWSSIADATDSRMITDFNQSESWTGGTWQTANARIGADSYRVAAAGTGVLADISVDLTANSNVDKFNLSYYSAAATSIKVVFKTDATNYFTATKTVSGTGYFTLSFLKTDFTATGTPSWGNITSMELTPTGGAVDFDGFRIDDVDGLSERFLLVSRTVLSTPMTKIAGRKADIEYRTQIS